MQGSYNLEYEGSMNSRKKKLLKMQPATMENILAIVVQLKKQVLNNFNERKG
jgi:hypothetical protein